MDYDAAANYAIMNQLCKVCGEPAAGFHFGAFTCEGCKSFFGRTYNNISSISECKNDGKCIINKKNRTACKACRLRKCMLVGMSKSGSRYGRRSNWFKIHCLLQQQQQQQQHQQQHHHPQHHHLQHPQMLPQNDLASAASLLRPNNNPYLSPLFRPAGGVHHHHHHHPVASGALPTVRDNTTPSNCGSDSGASSSVDPEDEIRSGSAFSYLKTGGGVGGGGGGGGGSPLSDRISDSDSFQKKDRISGKVMNYLNNNNNNNSNNNNNNNNSNLKVMPSAMRQMPHHPPSTLSPNNLTQNHHQRWFPTPFPVITDPAIWRELWLRGQPTIIAETAPDQDQPIDLSVKTVETVIEINKEVENNNEKERALDLSREAANSV